MVAERYLKLSEGCTIGLANIDEISVMKLTATDRWVLRIGYDRSWKELLFEDSDGVYLAKAYIERELEECGFAVIDAHRQMDAWGWLGND